MTMNAMATIMNSRGHEPSVAAKQAVNHVAAVELADRQHVEPGDQHADPAGHQQRVVLVQQRFGRQIRAQAVGQQLEQQRIAESHFGVGRRGRGALDAEPDDRQRDDQPRPGAGNADVEELLAIGARAFHGDHGSHRAGGQNRHGDEDRKAGRNVIAEGLQEVAHLVREQDADHGGHVDEPVAPVVEHPLASITADDMFGGTPIKRPGDERRDAGGDEQEDGSGDAPPPFGEVGTRQLAITRRGANRGVEMRAGRRRRAGPRQRRRLLGRPSRVASSRPLDWLIRLSIPTAAASRIGARRVAGEAPRSLRYRAKGNCRHWLCRARAGSLDYTLARGELLRQR